MYKQPGAEFQKGSSRLSQEELWRMGSQKPLTGTQHLLGFVYPKELLVRGLLKIFQLYLSVGGVQTLGSQETLFLEETLYVGSGSLIPDLIHTAGPWDPAPSQDIRAKPSGNAD